MYMTLYDQFIDDVNTGKLLSNRYVKLAVKRHEDDLIKSESESYPYYFNREKADRAIRLVKLFRHTAGAVANQLFLLAPYQAFVIASIFGWVQKKDDLRRFRRAYMEIARKGVKSELMGVISLIMLFFDNEWAAQVVIGATTKDQAKIVFLQAVSLLKKLQRDSPRVKQKSHIVGKTKPSRILFLDNESYMEPLSADSDTKDGLNVHCGVIDEYHAAKNDLLLGVIKTSMGQRLQPLIFIITTAGFNIEGPCYKERKVAINVLVGDYENERLFAIIFTLDEDDDWEDESVWIKANPYIGSTPRWEYMRDMYKEALEGTSKEIQFKTKNLNIWTNSSATWIKTKDYKKVVQHIDLTELHRRKASGGLDLAYAEAGDIVAFVLFFPADGEHTKHILYPFFFVSEEKVKDMKKGDGVDYYQWVRDGHLIPVPGNTIDYRFLKEHILNTAELINIDYIQADRFNTSQIILDLIDEGINMEKFGQGFLSMSAPTKQMEYWIKREEIIIHDNPVMHWMFSNVALKFDPAGNIKIDKAKSQNKVDGPVAAAMAIGGYLTNFNDDDKYTGEGPQAL